MTWTYAFDQAPAIDRASLKALLGGKGANLAVMADELGLPVPPGFVITTEACKAFGRDGWPAGLDAELLAQMARIGKQVGRGFGDPGNPLLVSVRSGAPVSMPGMLDTVLNIGLTEATTEGLAVASGDPAFAAGCQRRLESMYLDIVGADRVPDDPWQQLRTAVQAVFRSWDSDRARTYRERERIPADLGTAVVVQAMVFGNRGDASATGVLFTRNPATGENVLYGDVLFGAQGEDVVAGTHATEPISVLDERLPEVAAQLGTIAARLERHFRDVCDIEFTIEEGRLWMLQTRVGKRTAQAACRIAVDMAQDESFPLSRHEAVERVAAILADPPLATAGRSVSAAVIATGLGASPGLVSGAIATSAEAAVRMADQGAAVLLVRSETSPDDVHGMARAVGILTSTGGLASHAAVVARGWDIPAVVGAVGVVVREGVVEVGGAPYREGEILSIDGSSGEVFAGAVDADRAVVPEAEVLLRWAAELGIAIGREEEHVEMPEGTTATAGENPVTREHVIQALAIKGYVTADLLAPALGVASDEAAELLERLAADGIATGSGGMFSLSADGKALGAEMLTRDREAWGSAPAAAALDGFVVLDGRMKTIVTAWQMKTVDGQPVLNDHTDAGYDAHVLADLASCTWLPPPGSRR